MKRIACYLTNYIYNKGVIKKEDYNIYIYGFQSVLELGFCMLICIIIAVIMNALCEGIILWSIFFCVRSYAGGIHLKKYRHCLLFSCMVFSILIMLNKWQTLNENVSLCLCCLYSLIIVIFTDIYANNCNEEEQCYLQNKLKKRLAIILLASVVIYVCSNTVMLSMICYSLCAIAISVIIQHINC